MASCVGRRGLHGFERATAVNGLQQWRYVGLSRVMQHSACGDLHTSCPASLPPALWAAVDTAHHLLLHPGGKLCSDVQHARLATAQRSCNRDGMWSIACQCHDTGSAQQAAFITNHSACLLPACWLPWTWHTLCWCTLLGTSSISCEACASWAHFGLLPVCSPYLP